MPERLFARNEGERRVGLTLEAASQRPLVVAAVPPAIPRRCAFADDASLVSGSTPPIVRNDRINTGMNPFEEFELEFDEVFPAWPAVPSASMLRVDPMIACLMLRLLRRT